MSKKRAPGRSLDEWMELVTECRQSGLTDAAWCNEHGISPSCFTTTHLSFWCKRDSWVA
ncbi:MAG: IS66 family insertion sequence element accessory protein TnpA [Blautia sp.]